MSRNKFFIPSCFSCSLPVFLLGSLILSGCGPSRPAENEGEKSSQNSAREVLERKRLCSENFAKIYQILSPIPENMNSELQSAQDIMNQWFNSCAEWSTAPLTPEHPLFQGVATAAQVNELNQKSASQIDVLYLRDQLLMRKMQEHLIEALPTDVEKVRTIFEFVNRNVISDELLVDSRLLQAGLVAQETVQNLKPRSIPRTLQEVALSGRGTAEDRIWLFTALLQQLNMESLLVTPPAAAEEVPGRNSLVLVPLENEVLVFSPGLGVEFRAQDREWTAKDLTGDWKAVFDSLSLENPAAEPLLAPLKNADWKQSRLQIPASFLVISPRMAALQWEFVGDQVCEVYRPWESSTETGSGLKEQFQSAFGEIFPNFAPVFWDYPDLMYQNYVQTDARAELLRNLSLATLLKEVQSIRTSEDQDEKRIEKVSFEKRLLMARMEQLLGEESDSIGTYMKIRLQFRVMGEDQAVALENLMRFLQAEDAHYWSASAQYENEDYKSCSDTLENYLARYPAGRWAIPGRELLAEALIQRGEKEQALKVLQEVELPAPFRLRQLVLESEVSQK